MKIVNKIVLSAVLAFGLFGCKNAKILKVSQVLDGGSVEFLLAPQTSTTYDVAQSDQMDIEALIKPYNLSLDQVKSLRIESAEVAIIDSTGATFDIADNASIELGTSTIAQQKIAYKDPIPHTGLKLISLDVDKNIDLIPYAKSNNINYHLMLKLNKALDHAVIMKLSVKWKVEGEI